MARYALCEQLCAALKERLFERLSLTGKRLPNIHNRSPSLRSDLSSSFVHVDAIALDILSLNLTKSLGIECDKISV
jgi:hypothetical protein